MSGYILSGLDPLSGSAAVEGAASDPESAEWSLETLQAYLAHVRTLQPQPDADAVTVLQTYYQVYQLTADILPGIPVNCRHSTRYTS